MSCRIVFLVGVLGLIASATAIAYAHADRRHRRRT
ncbi:hypothetical protein FHS40_007499 [Streptomyces spectabilis]|uniref:Uncharacterized protein n=1 Tax=Streptomyces spectabilis TaxID=68270 RepID=A0A7W8B151_STRST|nr:hypothetical protein [Streptomyces spectabilis]